MKKILLLAFFTISCLSVNSAVYFLNSVSGSDNNSGLSPEEAFLTLDKVFRLNLQDGDQFYLSGVFSVNSGRQIFKSISFYGSEDQRTVIKAVGTTKKHNFISIGSRSISVNVKIKNLTFSDFDNFDDNVSTNGGVITVNGESGLTCEQVKFINNQSYMGGAVNVYGGKVKFVDCYFGNNRSLVRSTAKNADGGAINVSVNSPFSLDMLIERCLFENNSTENSGSALRVRSVSEQPITMLVVNSTFTQNVTRKAGRDYGAVLLHLQESVEGSDVKFINNTIAHNKTEKSDRYSTAGFSIIGFADNVCLINNIFFSNPDASGLSKSIIVLADSRLKESRNNITDTDKRYFDINKKTSSENSSGNIQGVNNDQLKLADGLSDEGGFTKTLSVKSGSLAVDAGFVSDLVPQKDQRNYKRTKKPDIGAFEFSAEIN